MPTYKPSLKSMKGCGKALGANLHMLRWERGKRRQELEIEPLAFYPRCGEYRPGKWPQISGTGFSRCSLLLCEECLLKYGIRW